MHALSGLSLSTGKLGTRFSPSVHSYTASVAKTIASIKIKPTLVDPNARVKVNGVPVKAGSRSAAIPLAVGNNTITIRVADRNGTRVNTYRIKVTRGKSPVATLSDLAVKAATLGPKFKPTTTKYTTSVPPSTKSVKIKATASHGAAQIKVNGKNVKSGTLSAAIPLKSGKNLVKVLVTAQDGSAMTYEITISRTTFPVLPVDPVSLAAAMTYPPRESMVSTVMHDGRKYLQLTIRRNPRTPKPVVEVSPNLVDWFSGHQHTTILVDDGEMLRVRDNTPTTPGVKRFIRASER
jgi:hypothetical protein